MTPVLKERVQHPHLVRSIGILNRWIVQHGWGIVEHDGEQFYVHNSEFLGEPDQQRSGEPVEFSWISTDTPTPPRRRRAYDVQPLRTTSAPGGPA